MTLSSPARPRAYLLKEAALILLFSYFLVLNGTTPLLLEQNIQWMSVILLSLLGLAWLLVGRRAGVPLGRPLAAFLLAFVISTIFSIDERISLTQLALTAAGFFLYALTADLAARGWPAELFIKGLLAAGMIEVAIVGVGALAWYRQWLAAAPGQWLPALTYRPYLANMLVMMANTLLLLALARLAPTRQKSSRVVLSLVSLALLALIYLTSSRGGWLGTAAGLAVLVGLWLLKRGYRLSDGLRLVRARPRFWLAVGVVGLLALAAAVFLALRQLAHPTHGAALLSRSEYWPVAWRMFLRHPIVGQGPYTYAASFLTENSLPPKYLFVHGHSILLNTLAEMGLVGLAAALWVAVAIVRALLRLWRAASGAHLARVIGVSAAFTALFVQGLVDCIHTDPLGMLPLLFALGAVLGEAQPQLEKRCRPWEVLPVLALVWFELLTVQPLYTTVNAANRGDWAAAEQAARQAVKADPSSQIADQQLALILGKKASEGDSQALEEALEQYRTSGIACSQVFWAVDYLNQGALYRQQGDLDRARAAFQAAVALAPRWPLAYLNQGLVAEQQNDWSTTFSAYRSVLDLSPGWHDAGFWNETPARQQVYRMWRAQAQPEPAEASLEGLRTAAAKFPQTTAPYLQLASAEAQARNWDAADHAVKLAALTWYSEADGVEMDWLRAEIAAGRGDFAAAADTGRRVLDDFLNPGVYGPGTFGQLRYAPFAFRRPPMAMELLPQVAVMKWTGQLEARASQVQAWALAAGDTAAAGQIAQAMQTVDPALSVSGR